jgi:serine/tyrosine/threonine adenylyltransferase
MSESEQGADGAGWKLKNTYTQLPEAFFSRVRPTPVAKPQIVIVNESLAMELGLDPARLAGQDAADIFAGNRLPPGSDPIAQAYAGHQFGGFTMLGDGRAILLGEQETSTGNLIDIQLKGSGPTPYSRRGDGRAALGPMLREYIISEAMHALGIPTTRSLAVAATGEPVHRERTLPGAVLTRTAASHIRVGTFEYAAMRKDIDGLRALADYTIARHYPELVGTADRYSRFLETVVSRQAALIVKWMQVGFVHGVMNTDNVSIAGESIDYGPCAFMNPWDPETVFSSIDDGGRYAFGNQPRIGQWNLARFAESLLPLLDPDIDRAVEIATGIINGFATGYEALWLGMMRRKLGLSGSERDDLMLVQSLLDWMKRNEADYTNTFRALTDDPRPADIANGDAAFEDWRMRWLRRMERPGTEPESARRQMRESNPSVIPRNHLVEESLAAAVDHGDLAPMSRLLEVLSRPWDDLPKSASRYRDPPPPDHCGYRTFCGT